MTDRVVIKITVGEETYGGTYAFSQNTNFSKKEMIMRAIESLTNKLDQELKEEIEDERF